MFEVNNKNTRTTYYTLRIYNYTSLSNLCIDEFEQLIVSWDNIFIEYQT